MTTVVVGAGVVGVACACYLAADGHEVVVVERNDTAAAGRPPEIDTEGLLYGH